MAWSSEHKNHSRQRILESAAKLFTKQGYDSVGIDDIMSDAGLTRGAFYSHFKSKSELYAESVLIAATQARENILKRVSTKANIDTQAKQLVDSYLSDEHRCGESAQCPLAFLATDISQRDDKVRAAYTKAFQFFVNDLEINDSPSSQSQKLQRAVLMIGGLAIARALNDDKLVDDLFSACREGIIET